MNYNDKRIVHVWETERVWMCVCEKEQGVLFDTYKQPAINPGAYSLESFGHKLLARIKGMCICDGEIDFI